MHYIDEINKWKIHESYVCAHSSTVDIMIADVKFKKIF